ncbi:putative hydrolase [Actinacidiphila reveromycinica]|uniref:Putative hydrolase n=1 Tax=Actinacidiphila reveromycinica TaxID=659352 RepID=A0A7U3UZ61_9ACTN|nr:alpha/beta hydrolase [Streptomyces sp. SN-593]BBB01347.1 putative hydrolase [Streptomyces sp. SN-593]
MPDITIDDTLTMRYEDDCFVEPWRTPETVLLVHGVGGSIAEWYAWVPPLAAEYRVVRVDLRGWGGSSIPPEGYPWSMDRYADDLAAFLDGMGLDKVHFVGTKLGGRIGLHFATRHPERLHTLSLVCTPMTIRFGPDDHGQRLPREIGGREGLERWARDTMEERLGAVDPAMTEWWVDLYTNCSPRVMGEVLRMAWETEEYSLLPGIGTPTLVVDSDAETPIPEIRRWQSIIPDSAFTEIEISTEGRQISASKPADCVAAVLDYLRARRPEGR